MRDWFLARIDPDITAAAGWAGLLAGVAILAYLVGLAWRLK